MGLTFKGKHHKAVVPRARDTSKNSYKAADGTFVMRVGEIMTSV